MDLFFGFLTLDFVKVESFVGVLLSATFLWRFEKWMSVPSRAESTAADDFIVRCGLSHAMFASGA